MAIIKLKAKGIFVAASKLEAVAMEKPKAEQIFVATSKLEAVGVGKSVVILSSVFLGDHFDALPWLMTTLFEGEMTSKIPT